MEGEVVGVEEGAAEGAAAKETTEEPEASGSNSDGRGSSKGGDGSSKTEDPPGAHLSPAPPSYQLAPALGDAHDAEPRDPCAALTLPPVDIDWEEAIEWVPRSAAATQSTWRSPRKAHTYASIPESGVPELGQISIPKLGQACISQCCIPHRFGNGGRAAGVCGDGVEGGLGARPRPSQRSTW